MALGADAKSILRWVLRRSAGLVAAGVLAGLVAAFISTRLMVSMLYGVSPNDPVVLAGGAASVVLVTLVGTLLPAMRAARTDPAAVLRDEV